MSSVIEQLQFCEFFSLLAILGILVLVGKAISGLTPESYGYGARIGYTVFLAYSVAALCHFGLADLALVSAVLIRALMFAGIAVGVSWCVMPLLLICRDRVRAWSTQLAQRRVDRQRQRQTDLQERVKQEAEQRAAEHRQQAKARIAQACSRCELLFDLHKPEIESRFGREMLDDFMKKYMHEEEADVVERRAEELCAIIERHREAAAGKTQLTTVSDLAKWFTEQQQLIAQAATPDELKESQLVMLSMRYERLFEEIIRRAHP